jgi:hypothetical protein
MKKLFITIVITIALGSTVIAQEEKKETHKQFMQITTVESVLAGGLGRSKMIITAPDGAQTEADLENLFSLVGINFKNIRQNEDKILRTLKSYTDNAWMLEQTTSLTLSQNDNGAGGIFMTRYLLSKPDLK